MVSCPLMTPPSFATAGEALAHRVPSLVRYVPSSLARLVVSLTLLILAPALLVPGLAHAAESPVGYWTTIDDDGKPSSIIQIFPRGKKLYGKIVQLINPREKDPKCTACEGKRKNQRIIGMEILRDFEQDGDEWSGGYILDPRDGTEYSCYLEVIENGKRLKVRGYVGIALLGRTQYWRKSPAPEVEAPKASPSEPPKAP
jgi:uncharacterized protein (DUF2147 family)